MLAMTHAEQISGKKQQPSSFSGIKTGARWEILTCGAWCSQWDLAPRHTYRTALLSSSMFLKTWLQLLHCALTNILAIDGKSIERPEVATEAEFVFSEELHTKDETYSQWRQSNTRSEVWLITFKRGVMGHSDADTETSIGNAGYSMPERDLTPAVGSWLKSYCKEYHLPRGLHLAPIKSEGYQSETFSAKPAAVFPITANVLAKPELLGYKQTWIKFSSITNK